MKDKQKHSEEYAALRVKGSDTNGQIIKNNKNGGGLLESGSNCSLTAHKFRDGLYQTFVSLGVLSLLIHPGIAVTLSTLLHPQLNITKYQNSWIASLLSIGMPIGSLGVGPLMDKIGRKKTCIFSAILTSTTWAMIVLLPESFDLRLLYIARFFNGIATGLSTSVIVYISEITNKHWRPVFLATVSVFLSSGVLVACTVGIMMPWQSFVLFSFVLAIFNTVILFFVPESPHWLFRSQPDKARRELMKLNKNKHDFNEEWENLERKRTERESGDFKKATLFSREVRRPMLRLALVFTFQQLGGGYIVVVYALQMFQNVVNSGHPATHPAIPPAALFQPSNLTSLLTNTSETTNSTGELATLLPALVNLTAAIEPPFILSEAIISRNNAHRFKVGDLDTLCLIGVGIIRVAMAALAVVLSKRVNSRIILISSAAGASVFAFAFALVFSGTLGPVKDGLPLIFILAFLTLNSYGMLVIPWTQVGELIPLSYRARGGGLMTAYAYVLMFLAVKTYPYAVDLIGLSGVFVFFGSVSMMASFYVHYFIPETRGKTFREIEEFFK